MSTTPLILLILILPAILLIWPYSAWLGKGDTA